MWLRPHLKPSFSEMVPVSESSVISISFLNLTLHVRYFETSTFIFKCESVVPLFHKSACARLWSTATLFCSRQQLPVPHLNLLESTTVLHWRAVYPITRAHSHCVAPHEYWTAVLGLYVSTARVWCWNVNSLCLFAKSAVLFVVRRWCACFKMFVKISKYLKLRLSKGILSQQRISH